MKDFEYDKARDHGLKPGEAMKSLGREVGLVGSMTQACWRVLASAYLATYHRFKVVGRENLPGTAPFILVCNHTSHLDTLALSAALPLKLRRSAFPIAAGDTFFVTPAASFFASMMLNALPLWRQRGGRHALAELRKRLLGDPAIFILFPEGTRTRDGSLGNFKPGIGMLIAESPAPVIPCHITGAFEALPADRRVPRPKKLTLRIGKPLLFEDVPNNKKGWLQVNDALRAAVIAAGEGRARANE